MIGILFLGVTAYVRLPIAGVPQVDIPTIRVFTELPGASPDTVASGITAPLERALSNLPGVASITSTSTLGNSAIDVQFDLSRSVDSAAVDVQGAINAAQADLPRDLPHPPTFEKANPADFLLMTIAAYSDGLPTSTVDDYVENYLAPSIARVRGVGLVDYHGQQKPAIRIRVDPRRLAAIGRTLEDVRNLVARSTVNGPKGTLNDAATSVSLDATDQLTRAAQYGNLVIATNGGAVTRLRDVGSVRDGVEDDRQSAWIGGHQAIMMDVHKETGYNVNNTVRRVRAMLPALERDLPSSIHLKLLQDRTQAIRASVFDVQLTLLLSCALVILVVFLFLGSVRATMIPAITIPLSLFASMGAMYWLGYTLDNVSLMALTISIGFVVDDAVVMLENVLRHIESGEDSMTAALRGSGEISFTVVAMTVSLVAVFIPVLFMGGIVGRLFHEFAATATVAILASGFVSLTLTPVLCSRYLRPEDVHSTHRYHVAAHRGFTRVLTAYERALTWSLGHRRLVLTAFALTAAIAVVLYVVIPKGFFPQQDDGIIVGSTEAEPSISYAAMLGRMRTLAAQVARDPAIRDVYYYVESQPSTNIGRLLIDLKPFGTRSDSATTVMARLRKRERHFPGLALYLQAVQNVTIGARITKTQYQYTLRDPDTAELQHWAPILLRNLRSLPQLRDVESDIDPSGPRVKLMLDRDAMARLGVTTQAVDDTLNDAYAQRQVASYYLPTNVYRAILEVSPRMQLDENALHALYVPAQSGTPIQLAAISRLQRSSAPLSINHDGQLPAVTLSFNLAPGASLGEAVAAVAARSRALDTPSGLKASFTGTAGAFQSSLATQPFLICAALLAIYIVLGMLYESYLHPVTILSTLPSAGIGGLLALMIFGHDFSLIALIGVILLIGIVKKNGIMMVDRALALEAQNLAPEQAIRQASLDRFRPIMMTTLVTLLAALPLAFGSGAGSELRRPLGIVMIGGLLVSQILTLFTTPAIHLWISRLRASRKASVFR